MLNLFLNPWMLLGLTGILLPVIAHLLSRKKYDQVDWGAMQFLELDNSAKRNVRLEEYLLMLVRMGIVALVAIAMARPWIGSDWLGVIASSQPRDVILIIDGSCSMGWDEKLDGKTPHIRAQQLAREFLATLRTGDAVQVIDARERSQIVLPESTRDPYRVKEAIHDLPPPAGSADLLAALRQGMKLLAAGTSLTREVVLFTDLQALSWNPDDDTLWKQFDDLRSQSPITPNLWIVDTSGGELGRGPNFSLEKLQLSRELAILGAPVRITSKVIASGSDTATTRKVFLEIDERRLNDRAIQIKIPPNGEIGVEFEYRFETPGSHLISLVLDEDHLAGDNRADAAVTITESLPVLLVDGDRQTDPTKSETFFSLAALRSTEGDQAWIKATVITPQELTIEHLKATSVTVMANVPTLNEISRKGLRQFVASGHSLLFTLGDRVDQRHYQSILAAGGDEIFPGQLEEIVTEKEADKRGVRILNSSLELPWLQPFRSDRGGSLPDARWSRWWKVSIPIQPADPPGQPRPAAANAQTAAQKPLLPSIENDEPSLSIGATIVEARLTTGDPLLISRRYGSGTTAVLTSSLDADWNTLPAKQDYVPFLHELLFSLAVPPTSRNLSVNSPLLLAVSPELNPDAYQFLNPAHQSLPVEKRDDEFQSKVLLRNTSSPGPYQFLPRSKPPQQIVRAEYFAVNFDRQESDLTRLTEDQQTTLAAEDRMRFIENLPDLQKKMFTESSRTEVWWLLLYVFLGFLCLEAWMTRRMVLGGYSAPTE